MKIYYWGKFKDDLQYLSLDSLVSIKQHQIVGQAT